jgi:hypothetical protein
LDRLFGTLGVRVRNGRVQAIGLLGTSLGPLAGAVISLTPESRARRVGGSAAATVLLAPALGPLPLLGMLAKKDRVTVYILFTNGQMHQRTIKGNFAVRSAHGEAMQFQAMAERATAETAAKATADQKAWLDLERKYAEEDDA